MELTRYVNGKVMRCGYTTGSCAAGAAKAAAMMLLGVKTVEKVDLMTPAGELLHLDIHDTGDGPLSHDTVDGPLYHDTGNDTKDRPLYHDGRPLSPQMQRAEKAVTCAVRKDSGDDPDITNGTLIYATVSRCSAEELSKAEPGSKVVIDGGFGVGRVTKPGLDQPVGSAAINSTPRRMIKENVSEVCRQYGYDGGIKVVISIPDGEKLAPKTFNPRLGIVGGISVVGTTGIVEPMSNQALVDTTKVEIRQLAAKGRTDIFLVPGNYGRDFARDVLGLDVSECIAMSNFLGDAINSAVECGFKRIFMVGHIGKMVKLGIGQTFTHSSGGDGRMETLIACALEAGTDLETLKQVLPCATTDAALDVLKAAGKMDETLEILGKRIEATLLRKVPEGVQIEYICFTNREDLGGVLCQSPGAAELADLWKTKA